MARRTKCVWLLVGMFGALPVDVMAAQGFIAGSFIDATDSTARISVQFRCAIRYIGHESEARDDRLHVRLETTPVCLGVAPTVAQTSEQHRPANADAAELISVEYQGDSASGPTLRFDFARNVDINSVTTPNEYTILLEIGLRTADAAAETTAANGSSRLVRRPGPERQRYVINLESWNRPPTSADLTGIEVDKGHDVFVAEAEIDGKTWYRIRLGYFASPTEASQYLRQMRSRYPTAWIDRANDGEEQPPPVWQVTAAEADTDGAPIAGAELADLMAEARRAMISGELSRAIQLYTKVLQQPANPHQQDAQEFLALARERNGQLAHAKAEYQRYLDLYPETDGADRVRQRIAAMVAGPVRPSAPVTGSTVSRATPGPASSPRWIVRTFASQYYRRDVNQMNEAEEIVSQSSVYSDVSIDARRRGDRFDFSTRVTAGYRSDLLDEQRADARNLRVSYAYADLVDAGTGLSGRLGRQTRTSGGVLGRFDGLNLAYSLTERVSLEAVAGKPVYSTTDGTDDDRSFRGLSVGYGPLGDNIELRAHFLDQQILGETDRQAVGGEFRYFGSDRSLWAMMDYDAAFSELSSVFIQGSWRLPGKLMLSGLYDHRRSPFLSLGNAIIGQPVTDFEALTVIFTEDELRQLALDRSALTTTVTLGLSRPLSPKTQLNLNATQSNVDATPASGGVLGAPASRYVYYSADLVTSSLFAASDVSILGLRYTESNTTNVYTVNVDTRFRVAGRWRISPRLRVDLRKIKADATEQWNYAPGLRLDYRWGKRVRLELQAGKQFSFREMENADQDQESYFVNAGYQVFF